MQDVPMSNIDVVLVERPLTSNMESVLAVIKDAKSGRISGWSIAAWLNKSKHPEGVRHTLRALTNRGLITLHPMDDPEDEFRKKFPDRLKAEYSIVRKEL